MAKRLLKREEVTERTGFSRSQIQRLEDQGRFPRRVKVSTNSIRWSESEIDAWIAEQLAARDAEAGDTPDDE